jgi:hypothetical protein
MLGWTTYHMRSLKSNQIIHLDTPLTSRLLTRSPFPIFPKNKQQALLKPFEHTSLKEGRYSQQLFNMANNL